MRTAAVPFFVYFLLLVFFLALSNYATGRLRPLNKFALEKDRNKPREFTAGTAVYSLGMLFEVGRVDVCCDEVFRAR